MRISCPNCGERDVREFTYLGSAKMLNRPDGDAGFEAFYDYVYLRDNPSGANPELWQHESGCRSCLHVIRNVTTHEVLNVKLVSEVKS